MSKKIIASNSKEYFFEFEPVEGIGYVIRVKTNACNRFSDEPLWQSDSGLYSIGSFYPEGSLYKDGSLEWYRSDEQGADFLLEVASYCRELYDKLKRYM